MTLTDTVLQYLQTPTENDFLALRREVAATPGFSPYASYEAVGFPLVEEGKLTEALAALTAMMPGSFLSPGLHNLLAFIHAKLNDEEAAENETYLAEALLRGILNSGDGSQERPFRVLQVSDEYDVLSFLGKSSANQTLLRSAERLMDRHACADKSVLWFDLTTPPPAASPVA